MEKIHALFSNQSGCGISRINEWDDIVLEEGTEKELKNRAREEGFKFIHLFNEEEDDYENTVYTYVTTTTTEPPAIGGTMWEAAQKERKETLRKIIEKVEGTYIRVESDWLKENAETLYDGILAQLDQFAADPQSPTKEEDVERWKKEGFMADIYFDEQELHTTAGFDVEELSTQPTWFVDKYEDYDREELKNLLLKGVAELGE